MGGGCGGAPGGVYGPTCGCGGCGTCGTNDWCAPGTMCSNCKGGFGPPISCAGCNNGCCPSLTFPCAFGATVNNPGCECCKEKTPPGKCKWPCMWPCCCTCTPPKFEFKPLKPEPVCHCPSPHSHHTTCGHHCLRSSSMQFSVLFLLLQEYLYTNKVEHIVYLLLLRKPASTAEPIHVPLLLIYVIRELSKNTMTT